MHIETPPFSVLALAPFSPALETNNPPIISVTAQSLDEALSELVPSLDIPVDENLCPDKSLPVTITRMADFRPRNLEKNIPFMQRIAQAETFLHQGGAPADLPVKFPELASLVTIPVGKPRSEAAAKASALDDILSMVETGNDNGGGTGSDLPDQLKTLRGKLLAAIFADDRFRAMEAAWSGLRMLARQAPSGTTPTVELHLVPLPAGDPMDVFDQVETQFAALPPDMILLDMPLSNSPRHSDLFERAMGMAESLLAPIFIPLAPTFLGIDNWSELARAGFIPSRLEGGEYGRWKTLVERTAAGWTVPCVNGVLVREGHPAEGGVPVDETPLFCSAAWGFGALCVKSVAVHGRATRLAHRSTVALEGLPVTQDNPPCALEMFLDIERIKDFSQAGILALAATGGRDDVFAVKGLTMDGGPLNFRFFLSRLTGFLIRLAMYHGDLVQDIERDLAEAITLFIQTLGLPAPTDVEIVAHEEQDGMTPLAISLTPDEEILPGGNRFTFGFGW